MYYTITKNGRQVGERGLSKKEALEQLMFVVSDFSSGYHYDSDAQNIYCEGDKHIAGKLGDENIQAGDDIFEIVEDEEYANW